VIRCIGILLLILAGGGFLFSRSIYVSPEGSDQNDGLSKESPLQTIGSAIGIAKAGDTIRLLPGIYYGKATIRDVHGAHDRPITIRSDEETAEHFAVIDGHAQPASNIGKGAFDINTSSWLTFENLKFQNCWTDVVLINNSSYLSFIGCIFMGGRRVIYPMGSRSHHLLIENCYWDQGKEVWTTHDWTEMHHGSLAYFNGALFHPSGTSGSFVMRGNTIVNVFNAFRSRPDAIDEDANGEIYDNLIRNVADNDFEPEGWAFNLHYYHNRLHNIHKMYSIDDVKGGPVYIYGNVITQSKDDNATSKVSGIWKYKGGPLSAPCYAFNNSYYTEAKVLKSGEGTNQRLRHYNNAYYFFKGSNRFQAVDCDTSFRFDYDCINQSWPATITSKEQEQNGIQNYNGKLFRNGEEEDLRLEPGSECIDAGKVMQFPEFDWVQSYLGDAPDIGAYEGEELVEGPPYRYKEPPGGDPYLEKPRIVRHRLNDRQLYLYFSAALDTTTVDPDSIEITLEGQSASLTGIHFMENSFGMVLETEQSLSDYEVLSVSFLKRPLGLNGAEMTYWASTLGYQRVEYPGSIVGVSPSQEVDPGIQMIAYPNPSDDQMFIDVYNLEDQEAPLYIYDLLGRYVTHLKTKEQGTRLRYKLHAHELPAGSYFAVVHDVNRTQVIKIILLCRGSVQ
jgi:hypothetical protein